MSSQQTPSGESPLERVTYALDLAQLAAEHDMPELSLEAVRRALENGPPIDTAGLSLSGSGISGLTIGSASSSASNTSGYETVQRTIEERLRNLAEVWREHDFDPAAVYDTLRVVVFPQGRSGETQIQLYARPLLTEPTQQMNLAIDPSTEMSPLEVRSVGRLLVDWAVKAGREGELRDAMAPLTADPRTKLPAEVILAQLAAAAQDEPALRESLLRIEEYVQQNSTARAAELACHAALPSLQHGAHQEAALPVVRRLIENVAPSWENNSSNIVPLATLVRQLARFHYARNERDAGREMIEKFLAVLDAGNQRYGGDYPLYLRRQQLGVAVFELLRAGEVDEGLRRLTERENISVTQYGRSNDVGFGSMLAAALSRMPAEQRFAALSAFSLEGRRIRVMSAFVPQADSDDPFDFPETAAGPQGVGIAGDLFCSVWMLLDTAQELGRADEVAGSLANLTPEQHEHAEAIGVLVELWKGSPNGLGPKLDRLQQTVQEGIDNDNDRPPYPMLIHVVAAEAARHPPLRRKAVSLLSSLITYTQRLQDNDLRAHARWALARTRHELYQAAPKDLFERAHPRHWGAAGFETAQAHALGSLPSTWVAQGGLINKLAGPAQSNLYFRYPLTGEFEISADIQDGGWAEGNLHFGGTTMVVQGYRRYVWMAGLDGTQVAQRPLPFSHSGRPNRQTVRVGGDEMVFLVNGHPIHTQPFRDSPWLALNADDGRVPVIANVRITGNPQIPRSVPLVGEDTLTGWVAMFYGERVRTAPATTLDESGMALPFDWVAEDGVIQGLRGSSAAAQESRLRYHRPLFDGEQIAYEFYYEPGVYEVHPSLGRTAFLLEPDGVALHRLTDGAADPNGLPADNKFAVGGPAPLPLSPEAWNSAIVRIDRGTASITLNGNVVYEHPVSGAALEFGLFHNPRQSAVRVRNVELSGDWPEELTPALLAELTAPRANARNSAEHRALNVIIGDRFWAEQTYETYLAALALDGDERYQFLYEWVMPGFSHSSIRMYAATTPTNPAPVVPLTAIDRQPLEEALARGERRIIVGGNLVSPARELVRTAAEIGKLDELRRDVESMETPSTFHTQSRLCLLTLIDLETGRAAEAAPSLLELYVLSKASPVGGQPQRWVDVIAAHECVLHEETRATAIDLMHHIVTTQLQSGNPGDGEFAAQVRKVRGMGWMLRAGAEPGRFTPDQWAPVDFATAQSNGAGHAPAQWRSLTGQLLHESGHDIDAAYFNTPLTGNFEIQCQLASFGWRETRLGAAGRWTGIRYTRNEYEQGHARRRYPMQSVEPQFPLLPPWYPYRLVVENGVYKSYVGDRLLHQQDLGDTYDPWVYVNVNGTSTGGIQQVRITGEPTIPDQIELLSTSDLSNWIFDYYGQTAESEAADWRLEGGVLIGRDQREAMAGMFAPGLIRYHRPMLEDGQIDYEFYYSPGKVAAHPALDRLVLLVEPSGIRGHWLTDINDDRTGLTADNAFDEPDSQRGTGEVPLRTDDWNQARLSVRGDTLELAINGAVVFERAIEPTNQRYFGLFHYRDQSELRVRNIVYRGDWPKSLRGLGDQVLARSPADLDSSRLTEEYSADFRGSALDPRALKVSPGTLGKYVFPDDPGLRMSLPAGEPTPSTVAVGPAFSLRGDFDFIAEFADLSITPPAQAWGAGIELHVQFDQDHDSRAQFERRAYPGGNHVLTAALHAQHQDGSSNYQKDDCHITPSAGTLKLSRRGGTLLYLFAPEGEQEFELLSEKYVGLHDVRAVRLRIAASDAVAGADVVWKSMTVRAEEFIDEIPDAAALGNEWTIDLAHEPLGTPRWSVPEPGGRNFVRRTEAGLQMLTPPNAGSQFGVSAAASSVRLEGDFDVAADFNLAALKPPRSGYGAGIQLRLTLDNPESALLHFCRRAYPDGTQAFAVHHVSVVDGERRDEHVSYPSELTSGRLRLVREGALVRWLLAGENDANFVEVATTDVGTAPVKQVALVVESSHPSSGQVDVVWRKLSMSADGLKL